MPQKYPTRKKLSKRYIGYQQKNKFVKFGKVSFEDWVWNYHELTLEDYRERINKSCEICDEEAEHLHHIISKRNGGLNIDDNRMALCKICHIKIHEDEM